MVPTHELQKGFYNTFSRQEISKRSIEPEERHNKTGNKSNNYLLLSTCGRTYLYQFSTFSESQIHYSL